MNESDCQFAHQAGSTWLLRNPVERLTAESGTSQLPKNQALGNDDALSL
jgi:hypothetical protein